MKSRFRSLFTRLLLLPVLLSACLGDGKKSVSPAAGRAAFEQKLSGMNEAELDTLYTQLCTRFGQKRRMLQQEWNRAHDDAQRQKILSRARKLLYTELCDSIFVCWYGTRWDFNGVTTCPRKGNIACGYFVTTILQQASFRLDRVYLAQQASSVMIKALCPPEKIRTISNHQTKKLVDHIRSRPDGIFVIGLDNHTGFAVKEGDSIDFVHSSFWPQGRVVRVSLEKSEIVNESNFYMCGELLYSDATIIKWINGQPIE